jgi:3-hydroxyisobutyrate dehydrogenase-like beta-hydroxyacid dehydrogenase
VFRCLGQDPLLIGPVGQAATLKLALNQLIAAEMAAFALSLGLVQRSGVSHETFMAVLRRSALHAPTFDKKLPRLLKRDYTHPNFSARHLLKDVELVLDAAQAAGLNPAGLRGVPALLTATIEQGLGDMDYSALFNAVNPAGDPGS